MTVRWPRRSPVARGSRPYLTTRPDRAAPRSGTDADAGSVSIMFVALFAGAIVLAGLLVDASRVLAANADASDLAGKAARAGAQEVDLASLRTSTGTGTGARTGSGSGAGTGTATDAVLDRAAAEMAARSYLDRHGLDGTVTATENTVTVTVHLRITYTLLALSGTAGETVTQTRSAVATRGP